MFTIPRLLKKSIQITRELWHLQHPKSPPLCALPWASSVLPGRWMPCCSTISVTKEAAALTATMEVSVVRTCSVKAKDWTSWLLCEWVTLWKDNWGKTKVSEVGYQRTGQASRDDDVEQQEMTGNNTNLRQQAKSGELQMYTELSSNPEKCQLFGFPMSRFWKVWNS